MKLFQKVKEIRSKAGDLHFQRFAIIETKLFSIYVHKIFKADEDYHLHSHPWNFFSLILKGSYIEEYNSLDLFGEPQSAFRSKKFLTFSSMKKGSYHKIKAILKGPIYSLFCAYGKKERWNYLFCGQPLDFERYREIKNTTGFDENGKIKIDWSDCEYYGAD